jgi:hypothetical protein
MKTRSHTSLNSSALFTPDNGFAAGSIDLSDRLGGYLAIAGMMVWTMSQVVPVEYLWNVQAARSFARLL